jgi:hypothetical protein
MYFLHNKNCSPNFSQKSHVKPKNHLTHTNQTRSPWHVSPIQPYIIKTELKKEATGFTPQRNSLKTSILRTTRLDGIFCNGSFSANPSIQRVSIQNILTGKGYPEELQSTTLSHTLRAGTVTAAGVAKWQTHLV